MKSRTFTLFLILLLNIGVYAQDGVQRIGAGKSVSPLSLLSPESTFNGTHITLPVTPAKGNASLIIHAPQQKPNVGLSMSNSPMALLDSVVTFNEDGSLNGKKVYTYDENTFPTRCITYTYNVDGMVVTGDEMYKWNKDGKLLEHYSRNTSGDMPTRYVYTLDESNYVLKQESFYANSFSDDEWIPSLLYEFAYDKNHNVLSETHKQWNVDEGKWDQTLLMTGEYDDQNRLIRTEKKELSWDGTIEWTGMVYTWDVDGRELSETELRVDTLVSTDLSNYMCRSYTYSDDKVSRMSLSYWNAEQQDWTGGYGFNGGYPNWNVYTDYTNDDKGREIMHKTYQQQSIGGDYVQVREEEHLYEPDDKGGEAMTWSVWQFYGGEKKIIQQIYQHNLNFGGVDTFVVKYDYGFGLQPNQENYCGFDDHNRIVSFISWTCNPMTGGRIGGNYSTNTYGPYSDSFTETEDFQISVSGNDTIFTPQTKMTSEFTPAGVAYTSVVS